MELQDLERGNLRLSSKNKYKNSGKAKLDYDMVLGELNAKEAWESDQKSAEIWTDEGWDSSYASICSSEQDNLTK